MKTTGATKDYTEDNKARWRRRVHLAISKRTKDRHKSVVLYLAGKDDLDRPGLIKRGFRPDNLIAVEVDNNAFTGLKNGRRLVINGTLNNVLLAWGTRVENNALFKREIDLKIDVIIADFCCGLTGEVRAFLFNVLVHPSVSDGATVVVNMMRGREQLDTFGVISETAPEFEDGFATKSAATNVFSGNRSNLHKHRGCHAMAMVHIFVRRIMEHTSTCTEEDQDTAMLGADFRFYSYKSGALSFDTVVFSKPELAPIKGALLVDLSSQATRKIKALKYPILGTLAERTKRINGTRPHSPSGSLLA